MAGMPGGLSEAKDVTPEVAEIVAAKKGDCESKSGKTFATFEPKKFVQQVVAGMIYKVKVSLSHSHDVRRHAHPPRFVCADTCLSPPIGISQRPGSCGWRVVHPREHLLPPSAHGAAT